MKYGEVHVIGTLPDGRQGPIDVLDLDEDGWRAFTVEVWRTNNLARIGAPRIDGTQPPGDPVPYRHRDCPGNRVHKPPTVEDPVVTQRLQDLAGQAREADE